MEQIQSTSVSGAIKGLLDGTTKSILWESRGETLDRQLSSANEISYTVYDGQKTTVHDVRGHVTQLSSRAAASLFPIELPSLVLLRSIRDANRSLRLIPNNDPQITLLHVRISDDRTYTSSFMTQQDWYFDPATHLPVSVEFFSANDKDARFDSRGSVVYVEWQTSTAGLMPRRLDCYFKNQLEAYVVLNDFAVNASSSTVPF